MGSVCILMRLLAIGDIHGCLTALETLLNEVRPGPQDRLVTLGDYVDRGPDSKGVIDRLLKLQTETQLIPLLGNHDFMFLDAVRRTGEFGRGWLTVGGIETIDSYGDLENVPESHVAFLMKDCWLYHEAEDLPYFFVHGSVNPHLPLVRQSPDMLMWSRITDLKEPHESGKIMVCGHTAQRSGLPLRLPYAIGIDTWAFGEGWLSCLDVTSGEVIQANESGEVRRLPAPA
jgi:serine/threonine protein phosphatase 1